MEKEKNKKPAAEQGQNCAKRGMMALMSKENRSDVLGSYTGTPADDDEPVQDADDL